MQDVNVQILFTNTEYTNKYVCHIWYSLLHRVEQNLTGNLNTLMPGGNKKVTHT